MVVGDSIDMIKIRNCFADWKNVHWIGPFPLHYSNAFIIRNQKLSRLISNHDLLSQIAFKNVYKIMFGNMNVNLLLVNISHLFQVHVE